jgi:hypothetical protein
MKTLAESPKLRDVHSMLVEGKTVNTKEKNGSDMLNFNC